MCVLFYFWGKKSFCAWTYRISLKGPSDFQVVSFDTLAWLLSSNFQEYLLD